MVAAKVKIPIPWRRVTGGAAYVDVEGRTVRELLGQLEARFPGLKGLMFEADGEVRQFINIFVDGEDIREEDGLDTAVEAGQEVLIIPAVAGG